MAGRIRIRRSTVAGKIPTAVQLAAGELAVNLPDGKLFLKQDDPSGIGTRVVSINANPIGNSYFVNKNGDDNDTGLSEDRAFLTVKQAAGIATSGDTINVAAGLYIEDNPIVLQDFVTIIGGDIRNCEISPANPGEDVIQLGQGGTVQDLSFVGVASTGAAVITYRPLLGTASDRFFDAARLIRSNINFIANETVGYITSTDYRNPAIEIDSTSCRDDIKDVYRAICHDITRGGNSKCIGAGKSYFDINGNLDHIVGFGSTSIDAFMYSRQIARAIINNAPWAPTGAAASTNVTNAIYGKDTGITTITAASHGLSIRDTVRLSQLAFTCSSEHAGVTTTIFPDGTYGYDFPVKRVIDDNTFEVNVGISTIEHTYDTGGTAQRMKNYQTEFLQTMDESIQPDPITGWNHYINGCANVVSAIYSCVGIVTGIIQNGLDGNDATTGFTTTYPGNAGAGVTDISLIPSQGVGVIRKGPYIRNCTNFVKNSIGARINGFDSDEGDQIDDIGVQGSFNVDAYTQFNQGSGIGVSVTNGAYCQLVSIFTICNDTAIYAGGGGQLDLTNSNSSFGTRGLVANGVGDYTSKCTDRYTGYISTSLARGNATLEIAGIGSNRPYSGQAVYIDKLYKSVGDIYVTEGGSGYTSAPVVTVEFPTGIGNTIRAQATAVVSNGKVTAINLLSGGLQYVEAPSITFTGGGGAGAAATALMVPLYYTIDSSTVPSAGVSTVTLVQNLNNDIGIGSTVFFSRQSLQIASSHSFEYIGAGNTITLAYPSRGGVSRQEDEVIKQNGGEVIYTSTDERGNFRIGDGVVINQTTGTISGRDYSKSLFSQITPFILALGD
ncbi:putative major tail protein [Synechococcus phage S-T4]|mgnify:CR=1 FL=1|jgi:hypothetical protein|uniref:Putative major tail protein n=1 Tax=Synechococcus phage S-T4 TaxID=2268578 RepID=A0A385EFA0_9CAUD|nr:putative major tail protein [Synechococcus phage S-T4]AXQ70473.1 putative major tail protein [Synechococcus phage S-T4]